MTRTGRREIPEDVTIYNEDGVGHPYPPFGANVVPLSDLPAIRKQERERVRDAVGEPMHTLASTIGRARVFVDNRSRQGMNLTKAAEALGRLRGALDTPEGSGDD